MDADARTVRIDDDRVLHYDTPVYGLGSVADTSTVPGVEEYAYTLNGPQEAEAVAHRLAGLGSGTVVVGGSGLTGVESAAEIAERHPELDVVLPGRDEPGALMNPKAGAYVRSALDRLGVRVRSGCDVVKVLPDSVELAGGESIAAGLVLWTSGTRVSPLAAAAGLEVDERGRVVTDTTLRSTSHPEVYAVGDAAAVRQGYGVMHGTCQGGMPTGVHAAVSVLRTLRGKRPKPFRFGHYHTPASRTVTYQGVEPADMEAELVEINGGPGLVLSGAGRVIATVTFDFDEEGRIATIHNVANPDKLGAVGTGAPYSLGTR
nr:FAD-dependent oxidoreductase [Streptomyces sp. S584]